MTLGVYVYLPQVLRSNQCEILQAPRAAHAAHAAAGVYRKIPFCSKTGSLRSGLNGYQLQSLYDQAAEFGMLQLCALCCYRGGDEVLQARGSDSRGRRPAKRGPLCNEFGGRPFVNPMLSL